MGITSIAPAFPKISEELEIPTKTVSLLITFFTLPGIFLSPVLGVLADHFGRKRILTPSLFLFGIAGVSCAFVNNFNILLLLRFIQGVGAASLGSLNLTIIGDLYTGKDRISAMGYNASVLSFGTLIYPVIGGAIALIGWNYPFFLSLLAIPVGLLILFVLDNPEPKNMVKINEYLKNILKLIKKSRIIILYFISLTTFILLYGVILAFFPFFLKANFQVSPLKIGIVISSASIGTIIGAYNLKKLTDMFSARWLIISAFFLYAVSIYATISIDVFELIFIPAVIYGFANGINIPSTQTIISSAASMEYRGAFMSLNSTVLRLGQTVGPLLTGITFGLWGFPGVFYASGIFAFLIFALLIFILKE